VSRHSSLAVVKVDRTADYYAKPEVRMAPDFAPRHRRGQILQRKLRAHWLRLDAERKAAKEKRK